MLKIMNIRMIVIWYIPFALSITYTSIISIPSYTTLQYKLIGQHVWAYFSSHHHAIIQELKPDDGLKNKPKRVA
jgi:hypothetical protein